MVATSSPPSLSSFCFLSQKLPSINSHTISAFPPPSSVRFQSPRVTATYSSAERTRPPPHLNSSCVTSPPASLYEVLGIPMGATCHDIKSAYRQLARVCHPDSMATDRKDRSANEFMKIHAAYSTLSDPQKRVDYDRELFGRQQLYKSPSSAAAAYASSAASSSVSGFSSYTRRTWETDQCW